MEAPGHAPELRPHLLPHLNTSGLGQRHELGQTAGLLALRRRILSRRLCLVWGLTLAARCLRRDLDTVDLVPSMAAITLLYWAMAADTQKIKEH